jgi:hypothetical protein
MNRIKKRKNPKFPKINPLVIMVVAAGLIAAVSTALAKKVDGKGTP